MTRLEDYYLQEDRQPNDEAGLIILVGPSHRFSRCYLHALRSEFSNCEIKRCTNAGGMNQLPKRLVNQVRLVIVHEDICSSFENILTLARATFPHQPIALAYHAKPSSYRILQSMGREFDGHLPMDVRFDLWLSIVQLLMSGGHYVAPELMHGGYTDRGDEQGGGSNSQPPPHILMQSAGTTDLDHADCATLETPEQVEALCKLTPREFEVLKLVSQGQQNKNIANALGLSEHTVKLHMHNIISKLKVSNRTEAAAIFLNSD